MHQLTLFLKTLWQRFFSDLCLMRAASLTFTTLLSIVPLVIFVFYMLSFFPALQHAGKEMEYFILRNFVANSAAVVMQQLQSFVTNIKAVSLANLVALIVIAMLMIFSMVDAINGVWHVKMNKESALSFFFYLITLFVAPIFFAILLLISSYLTSLPFLSQLVEIDVVRKPLVSLFPFSIEWIVFTLFHLLIPSCRVYFRYAVMAGFVTAVLFELAKWGFVQYIHYFPTYQWVYGALAAIPLFFVWIYLSWLILIVGALICQLLQTRDYLKFQTLTKD